MLPTIFSILPKENVIAPGMGARMLISGTVNCIKLYIVRERYTAVEAVPILHMVRWTLFHYKVPFRVFDCFTVLEVISLQVAYP